MEQTTDNIQTALAAGAASVQPVTSHGGIPFVAVPDGYKVHDLESLLPVPTRKRAEVTITDTDSFIHYTKKHGVTALTTALTQANAALLLALTEPTDDAPAGVLPPEISRELLGQVVDEVFGGAIEDATVIEDIYRVIARSVAPPRTGGLEP